MRNLEKRLERLEAKRPSQAWVIARKITHEDGTITFPTDRDRQLIESGEATFVIHHRVVGARPSSPPAREGEQHPDNPHDHPFKPKPVRRRYVEFGPGAHDPESHGQAAPGIPKMDSSVWRYPLGVAQRTYATEKPNVDTRLALLKNS